MIISVPTALELVSTNVIDTTSTFNPAINMGYPKGTTIQSNGWIYENTGANITPIVWVSGDASGYPDGTVVYKDNKLQLWYSSPTQRLAQPEEYTIVDDGKYTAGNLFKADTWTHKYVNLGVVPLDQTLYDPDFAGAQADASSYLWYTWIDSEGVERIGANIKPETSTGESAWTVQAPYVYTELTESSIETKASLSVVDGKLIGTLGTIVKRGNDWYMRTSYDADTEYISVTGGYGIDIVSIDQLAGFTKKEMAKSSYPFDGKNYTTAKAQNTMTYTLKGLEAFDTLALGRVKADNVVINFKDPQGTLITNITKPIDTSRDANGNLAPWHTTLIYYSDAVMAADSTVEITLTGTDIELGTLMLGMSVDAGFTNLELTNKYRDFSVFEYDAWGNADYVERAKISTYSGTVKIFITDYDRIDRLMTSLGKNLVIVNGSDSKNAAPNSSSIFASTQKIGRFVSFDQKTQKKDGVMGVHAVYSFTLEGVV